MKMRIELGREETSTIIAEYIRKTIPSCSGKHVEVSMTSYSGATIDITEPTQPAPGPE